MSQVYRYLLSQVTAGEDVDLSPAALARLNITPNHQARLQQEHFKVMVLSSLSQLGKGQEDLHTHPDSRAKEDYICSLAKAKLFHRESLVGRWKHELDLRRKKLNNLTQEVGLFGWNWVTVTNGYRQMTYPKSFIDDVVSYGEFLGRRGEGTPAVQGAIGTLVRIGPHDNPPKPIRDELQAAIKVIYGYAKRREDMDGSRQLAIRTAQMSVIGCGGWALW